MVASKGFLHPQGVEPLKRQHHAPPDGLQTFGAMRYAYCTLRGLRRSRNISYGHDTGDPGLKYNQSARPALPSRKFFSYAFFILFVFRACRPRITNRNDCCASRLRFLVSQR